MPSPKEPPDVAGLSDDPLGVGKTPTRQRKHGDPPSTPRISKGTTGRTPNSAPEATRFGVGPGTPNGAGAGIGAMGQSPNGQRRLSQSQKIQPTLLTDFLLGRQSHVRLAAVRDAQRKRSVEVFAVKAEVRAAMRQSSVRRLQPPGGVRDRVKAWQKSNATALATGYPDASPSEPTERAFDSDKESVTEADRLRIKSRGKQKQRKVDWQKPQLPPRATSDSSQDRPPDSSKLVAPGYTSKYTAFKHDKDTSDTDDDVDADKIHQENDKRKPGAKGNVKGRDYTHDHNYGRVIDNESNFIGTNETDGGEDKSRNDSSQKLTKERKDAYETSAGSPPKKRIISDEHWMKRRTDLSPASDKPKPKPRGGYTTPIPPDFLQRNAQSPSVQNKIKDWAKRVDLPDDQASQKKSGNASLTAQGSGRQVTDTKNKDSVRCHPNLSDNSGRTRPLQSTRSAEETRTNEQRSRDKEPLPLQTPPNSVPSIRSASFVEYASQVWENSSSGPPETKASPGDGIRARSLKLVPLDDRIQTPLGGKPLGEMDDATMSFSSRPRSSAESQTTCFARSDPATHDATEKMPRYSSVDTAADHQQQEPGQGNPKRSGHRTHRRSKDTAHMQMGCLATHAEPNAESGSSQGSSYSSANNGESYIANSCLRSSMLSRSLADIPVGQSAFSELDLPLRGSSARAKGRSPKNPSFKGVPHVLKRVVSEGKKMIHDKVDSHRPVANQPPSIENWLETTVDPFVEGSVAQKPSPTQRRQSTEEVWRQDERKPLPPETRRRKNELSPTRSPRVSKPESRKVGSSPLGANENETTPVPISVGDASTTTPTKRAKGGAGLKRSGATRIASSPVKPAGGKKPFREALWEAFHGESAGHKPPITSPSYTPGCQLVQNQDVVNHTDYGANSVKRDSSRRPSESGSSGPPPPGTALLASTESDGSHSSASSATTSSELPRHRPPPTSGDHELSTIVSVESSNSQVSDTISTASTSTITQTTAATKTSGDMSRQKNQNPSPGLKRTLTKHSELVSVLSLPDDQHLPARSKSRNVARKLHRKTSKLDDATLDDLLLEFKDDEWLYEKELKTLVDGVIPVLLTQFVNGDSQGSTTAVFGYDSSNLQRTSAMSRAVVDMGVLLKELNDLHRCIPLHDAPNLVRWLEAACPLYNNYLDAWRLGFQGVIINLAPAQGKCDEADSLLNAMSRNDDGDILDENGERVDVAYLLRRPLVRIKWMLKFAKGVCLILGRSVAGDAVSRLEALHEKARRRHREETARNADEDANATDTTRTRYLRSLAPLEKVTINQTRQVSAKDWFNLDMSHSNGQRLECQVEMVFRDTPSDPSDFGDILIRETGGSGQSWLLFEPILLTQISARRSSSSRSLLVMVRGEGNNEVDNWYELMTLVAECDDTATDWLNIMGSNPVPPVPSAPERSKPDSFPAQTPTLIAEVDVPLGERRPQAAEAALDETSPKPNLKDYRTPNHYHRKQPPADENVSPAAASRVSSTNWAETPTELQHDIWQPAFEPGSQIQESLGNEKASQKRSPLALEARESSQKATTLFAREDGAPPPPVHRILKAKLPQPSSAPAEVPTSVPRIRRRTSSPLKHEYHPSDISSASASASESSGSDSDSSFELDDDDIPDALPGTSIKTPCPITEDSVVSDTSITPSSSASQAGAPGIQRSLPQQALQFTASISFWSNKKGIWKDLDQTISNVVITPGLIEAFVPGAVVAGGSSRRLGIDNGADGPQPLIALDLTPLVMIRQSTVIDLEIRSPVRSYSKYHNLDAGIFRFRAPNPAELANLYMAVHQSRMDNAKFKALEEEARFRSFGQGQTAGDRGDDSSSHRRRSWFGRKNSYRASVRAPSQSQGSSSSISATSFLRKLTGGGTLQFNIDRSFVDRQSRTGSGAGASLYTSSGSSSAGGGLTPPRSPSVSLAESSNRGVQALGSSNIKMRCHLQVSANKWEDHGDCLLTVERPPPGFRQELAIYHGLEKRVLVVSMPKRDSEKPLVVLDVVLGSACFTRLAARGIVLNVWEEVRDEGNRVGAVPAAGALSGRVRKWCFQFSSAAAASWVYGLVATEVEIM